MNKQTKRNIFSSHYSLVLDREKQLIFNVAVQFISLNYLFSFTISIKRLMQVSFDQSLLLKIRYKILLLITDFI